MNITSYIGKYIDITYTKYNLYKTSIPNIINIEEMLREIFVISKYLPRLKDIEYFLLEINITKII